MWPIIFKNLALIFLEPELLKLSTSEEGYHISFLFFFFKNTTIISSVKIDVLLVKLKFFMTVHWIMHIDILTYEMSVVINHSYSFTNFLAVYVLCKCLA